MYDPSNAHIRSAADYEPTPAGLAERWEAELVAADKAVEKWHERAKKIEDRYQDERGTDSGGSKLNLWHSDVETEKALVYDNQPKVHVRRRNADADDDVARVSAEIAERHLNADIEREDDGFQTALEMVRDDFKLAGLGLLRFRYVVDWEDTDETPAQMDEAGNEVAPSVPAGRRKSREDVETDHVVWEDVRWSPCRNRNELRWIAFGASLTLDEALERFPDVNVEELPVESRREDVSPENRDTWTRIKVWEIWDKPTKTRYMHVRGHNAILEATPDPLELPGFFPCPRPLMANVTSRKYMPVPDFVLAQDLYDEIDTETDTIRELVDFVRVVGACDADNSALAAVLDRAKNGKIIPVENFSKLWGESGLDKAIWMLDIVPIVNAINALVAKRQESILQLQQVTGNSDIMRGGGQVKTATQSRMEGRFGASRTRSKQKALAKFAQESQRIRMQIIARWFDPETIIERSNIEAVELVDVPPPPPPMPQPGMPPAPPAPQAPPKKVPNRPLIDQAVSLLKSDIGKYRIEIAEDSLAMTDYDAVKQERTETITALGGFFQAMAPMMMNPSDRPTVMRLAQWLVAGMRGASQAESVLDEAVREAEKKAAMPPQPPPPDPKLQAAQVKAQAEMGKAKAQMQQTQMDAQTHAAETQMDMQVKQAEFGMDMAKLRAQREAKLDVAPITEGQV